MNAPPPQAEDWLDLKNTSERRIIDMGARLKTNLKVIGRYQYKRAMPAVPMQRNSKRLVLALLLEGLQPYEVDNDMRLLRGGQGIRFLPGMTYGSGDQPQQPGRMFWLVFDQPSRNAFKLPGLKPRAAREWWTAMSDPGIPRRFPLCDSLKESLMRMDKLLEGAGDSIWNESELCCRLGLIFIQLFNQIGRPLNQSLSDLISRSLQLIDERMEARNFGIEDLARELGISSKAFRSRFKNDIGMSPADYLMRNKILFAQGMLRKGMSSTEIAEQLGFSSSQYFSTVFKRYTLLSPSQWRDRNRKAID